MSKKSARKNFCELLKNNKINIIVGTHSLISEGIEFDKLGLAIVDEQHRFGVEQRKSIREKNDYSPHFLSMTATPIPRSFALALYGDLDVSIMNQMPQGRKPIKTKLVSPDNRDKAYEFIRNQIKHGRQAFVICPLIDTDSETRYSPAQEKKTVLEEYEKLKNKIFSEFQVSFLHGKMKSSDKESAMKDFACGKINILVATSVIEVGINVPNASVMMIEGADRFGLAQLHQFRGRVGRSVYDSYCFLFTDTEAQSAIDRLLFFEKTNDGFKVAEYDLETRGPGEVYGTAQSGEMRLKFATMKDIDLIKSARDIARSADFDKYPILKDKVKEWEQSVHLE
jgi:ATP-dependent DNA helicase RecG